MNGKMVKKEKEILKNGKKMWRKIEEKKSEKTVVTKITGKYSKR